MRILVSLLLLVMFGCMDDQSKPFTVRSDSVEYCTTCHPRISWTYECNTAHGFDCIRTEVCAFGDCVAQRAPAPPFCPLQGTAEQGVRL